MAHNYSNHLRGDVIRGAAECPSLVSIANALFAESKVRDLDMTVGIEHDVVQLEVAVDDATLVKV